MRRLTVPLIMVVTVAALLPLRAQAPSGQVRGADFQQAPTNIQEAESEGSVFPREAPPPSLPPGFGEVKGTDERKCVAFPDGAVLSHTSGMENSRRSDDFVVGGQIIEGLKSGVIAKVFWAPLHDPASRRATLLVRSVQLDQACNYITLCPY
jgi:hypothetical protein